MWNVSMKDESDAQTPKQKVFEEGEHFANIVSVELCPVEPDNPAEKKSGVTYSKSGNPYFLWILLIDDGEIGEDEIRVRTTLKKGKRWLLKQTLSACGIEASKDDPDEKYKFDKKDVIDKKIIVHIVNKENTFNGREGNLVTFTK